MISSSFSALELGVSVSDFHNVALSRANITRTKIKEGESGKAG